MKNIPNLNHTTRVVALVLAFSGVATSLFADGAGTSSGLTLREAAGARPMALGEAFSASSDDITGLAYNPASLSTLKSGQASFFYRTGIADDSYGQFMIGSPSNKGAVGLSIGYFNGGKADVYDGQTQRSVNVQRDFSLALGYSTAINKMRVGLAGKYLSSELAEKEKATAFAADAGIQYPLTSRLAFGSSVQNIGSSLKYKQEADALPRLFRTGLSLLLAPGRAPAQVMVEGVYDVNARRTFPAVGIEKSFGLFALRGGYQNADDLAKYTLGMGVQFSRFSFDYTFGVVNQFDSKHMVSFSTRFETIAQQQYGRKDVWRAIYGDDYERP